MRIFYLNNIPEKWCDEHNKLLKYVSTERKKHVLSYRNDSDKLLSLYAALLVRYGICNMTDYNGELTFTSIQNHKPYCNELSECDFNFAHTDGAILCGITFAGKVGADIEKINEAPFEIMEDVFCKEEIEYINADVSGSDQRFFEMWTAKEAYTKCIGIGLVTDIKSINMIEKMNSDNLKIWKEDDYVCSIYSEGDSEFYIERVSSEMITKYFDQKK